MNIAEQQRPPRNDNFSFLRRRKSLPRVPDLRHKIPRSPRRSAERRLAMLDKVRTTTLSTVGPLCSSCEDAVLLGQKKGVSDYFPPPPLPSTPRTSRDEPYYPRRSPRPLADLELPSTASSCWRPVPPLYLLPPRNDNFSFLRNLRNPVANLSPGPRSPYLPRRASRTPGGSQPTTALSRVSTF